MLLLALDTATPAVTVALHDGHTAVASRTVEDARRHGELLLPGVERVLAEAGAAIGDVTAVAVGVGPGPYTGLRVGLVTAASFGDALGVPVHGVCTLDAIAYAAGRESVAAGPFVVATDARRKEVYWARYADPLTRTGEPAVDRAGDIAERVAGLPAVGAGAALYPEVFADVRPPRHAAADALAALVAERLTGGGELLPALPMYLRRPDAQVPAGYKQVLPR